MHDTPRQSGSMTLDLRCIPDVEGMLALVKQGRRSIGRSISG